MNIAHTRNPDVIPLVKPNIEAAIKKSQAQVSVGVNLPYALYHIAEFELFLGNRYKALYALARAVKLSKDATIIAHALVSAELLGDIDRHIAGLDSFRQTLELALAARSANSDGQAAAISGSNSIEFRQPVVIVAGSCTQSAQKDVEQYKQLLLSAFRDFTGTIISGGTKQGVSGLVADVCDHCGRDNIQLLGYLPASLPSDGSADRDERYEIIRTDGQEGFSPLEPLQYWRDIMAGGIRPQDVILLGINGGYISAFEYHLASALGAVVALLSMSGGQADRLMRESDLPGNGGILFVPEDAQSLYALINRAGSCSFTDAEIQTLADVISVYYLVDDMESKKRILLQEHKNNPARRKQFEQSNREQAIHIFRKLQRIDKQIVPIDSPGPVGDEVIEEQHINMLAEMEHGRWVIERLLDGWRPGPRNDALKQRPTLIPWCELPQEVKEKDIQAVRQIPGILRKIGYKIVDM